MADPKKSSPKKFPRTKKSPRPKARSTKTPRKPMEGSGSRKAPPAPPMRDSPSVEWNTGRSLGERTCNVCFNYFGSPFWHRLVRRHWPEPLVDDADWTLYEIKLEIDVEEKAAAKKRWRERWNRILP